MSHPVLFPTPDKCGSLMFRSLMARWHIRIEVIAFRAGVSQRRIQRWLWNKVRKADFVEFGAVYDAMFSIAVEKAEWQAAEMKRAYAEFQARRAKAIEAGRQA